jgi:hypothetical protein
VGRPDHRGQRFDQRGAAKTGASVDWAAGFLVWSRSAAPDQVGSRAKATISHLALQAVTILVFARISLYKCFPRFLPETVAEVCGEHSGNEQLVQRALSALRTDLLAVPLAAATKQAVLARFPAHEPESPHL